jgi:2-iminobutanoate/2-iminopropanoate deaminase
MKYILLLFAYLTSLHAANAQQMEISKDKWHWGNPLKQDTIAGYAQVVKVDNILYISGAVSNEVTAEGIARVYEGLQASLESFGAGFQNVVKENLYTTDMEAMKQNNHVRKQFYKGDFPAATWVAVPRLYMEDAKLEVELVAHLP